MSDQVVLSILTLPIELIYCILDNLDELTILFSARDVCTRLNLIIDTYHRYKVNFIFISLIDFYHLQNIIQCIRDMSAVFENQENFLCIYTMTLSLITIGFLGKVFIFQLVFLLYL
jgi:hypothetical protein